MAAAVSDYRPAEPAEHKLRKGDGPMTLELSRNPDILAELGGWRAGPRPMLVGFALGTRDVVAAARAKLADKGIDLVVANHADDSFGKPTNVATLVAPGGSEELPELPKEVLADRILDRVVAHLEGLPPG